ncbi:MAG: hypothetical protein M1817_003017 [Caeruleum heppii]|nr:MAG: hypothetical protein M1817_003017 [Caeruleum heppii]
MHLSPLSTIFTLSSLSYLASGLPLASLDSLPRQPLQKRAPPYSVVPIDGGASEASAKVTTTKVHTVTESATSTEPTSKTTTSTEDTTSSSAPSTTAVSTIVLSESEPERTVVVTTTQEGISTIIVSVSPSDRSDPVSTSTTSSSTSTLTSSSTLSSASEAAPAIPSSSATTTTLDHADGLTSAPTHTSTVYQHAVAVPLVTDAPATSPQSFDNGQWHTTYPSWNGTSKARRAAQMVGVRQAVGPTAAASGGWLAPRASETPRSNLAPGPSKDVTGLGARIGYLALNMGPAKGASDRVRQQASPTPTSTPLPKLPSTTADAGDPTQVPAFRAPVREHKSPRRSVPQDERQESAQWRLKLELV